MKNTETHINPETYTFRSQNPLLSRVRASTDNMILQKFILFCIKEITYPSVQFLICFVLEVFEASVVDSPNRFISWK